MVGEILLALIIGVLCGIVTGLVPGIHVNLVSATVLSLSGYLLSITSAFALSVFLASLALTHTFLDAIPSIFLGAPDPDMVLSVLPVHQMLLEGRGYDAVKLTVIGSLFSLLAIVACTPLVIPLLPLAYMLIEPVMGYLLIAVVFFMIMIEKGKGKFFGIYIFLQAGTLGLIVLNMPSLDQPLFPMLTGLFGISTLLLSLGEKSVLPKQQTGLPMVLEKKETVKAVFAGLFSGALAGLLPGLGSAQASILGMLIAGKNMGREAYLILVGGINTVNFAFSLATFYVLDKARNGAIVAVSFLIDTITIRQMMIIMACFLIVAGLASALTLWIAGVFAHAFSKIDSRKLSFIILCFVTLLVFALTHWLGLFVMLASTAVGLMPPLVGVKRSLNMGCLLLPVILYFV